MTTPGGVPNLPVGALTIDNLESTIQDMSGSAMKSRAVERFPSIMDGSTGLSPASDYTPFGILTRIFSEVNSRIATADPADVQGPEDLPDLVLDFIESLPVVGQFVGLGEAILGTYDGDDQVLLQIQEIFAPLRKLLQMIGGIAEGNIPTPQQIEDGFAATIAPFQDLIESGWKASFGAVEDGIKHTVQDFENALKNIPPINVGGIGGLADIGTTIQTTLDRLWSGLKKGGSGSQKSIADVANSATDIATQADTAEQIGVWNNAILGIRDNNPFDSGMDPTAVSMFPLPAASTSAGDPPYISVTSASVPIAFWIATDDAVRGSVQWEGKGITNVTALYLDIYCVDKTTGQLVLLHSSPDQVPKVTSAWQPLRYDMAAALRQTTAHGDILAVGFRVTGSGTHQVACRYARSGVGDVSQVPQRPAATRTGVGTIALTGLTWAGDVPWIALGIVTGDVPPPYYAPRTTEITAEGAYTYDIPTWANYLDVVLLGAGGGGRGGNTVTTIAGEGGDAGTWATETLQRGVDFPIAATQISGVVGTHGVGGTYGASGTAGTATTRAAVSSGKAAITAAGGAGGSVQDNSKSTGDSPGNQMFQGQTFVGGGTAAGGRPGATGAAAGGGGGGGYGGTYGIGFNGGNGARGGAWIVARQT